MTAVSRQCYSQFAFSTRINACVFYQYSAKGDILSEQGDCFPRSWLQCTFRAAETVATDESLRRASVFMCQTAHSCPPPLPTSTESVKHGAVILKFVDYMCDGLNCRSCILCQAGTKVAWHYRQCINWTSLTQYVHLFTIWNVQSVFLLLRHIICMFMARWHTLYHVTLFSYVHPFCQTSSVKLFLHQSVPFFGVLFNYLVNSTIVGNMYCT